MTTPIIPANYRTPIDALQINFGVVSDGPQVGPYAILLVANRTTAGTGTVDTTVYGPTTTPALSTETDVTTLAGSGSEAHRLWLRVRSVLNLAQTLGVTPPPVYAIFPTESAGVQASLDFLIVNASTTSVPLRFYVGDDSTDIQLSIGQSVDSIGAALVVAINSMTRWPVTASYNTGTDTLTLVAKQHGTRGNEIRAWAKILGVNATTIANNVSTALSGGTLEDSWTTALATLASQRFYYIVSPSTNTAGTNFDDLVTQVLAQAQPLTGIRQKVIAGHVGTQAAASTVAANAAINTERCDIAWLQSSELTAGELAAKFAAVRAVFETKDWTYNFRAFGNGTVGGIDTPKFWGVPVPQTQANWPTPTSIETALNNGLTAIGVDQASGNTYITRSQTTRHKNGSNFDYSVADTHIVSGLDHWSDRLLAKYSNQYGACKIINDLADGEKVPGDRVVQPRQIRALILGEIDDVANSQLKDVAKIKAGVVVQRSSNTRVSATIPARVIDLLLQSELVVNDLSAATS